MAALLVRLSLQESFGEEPAVIVFVAPIILSAYVGGLGPGLVSTMVSAASAAYFLIPPLHSFEINKMTQGAQELVLIGAGVFISIIVEVLHHAQERLRRMHDELEQRVRERTSDLEEAYDRIQKAKEDLRFLAGQLLISQEQERKRISFELHDDIGQSLAVLKMQLRAVGKHLSEGNKGRKDLEAALNSVNYVVATVRRISKALSPSILGDIGLSEALKELFRETCERQNINCTFESDDIQGLFSPEAQIVIYRIFQEISHNIIKHARASSIELHLKKLAQNVQFRLTDNGCGFDVEQVLNSRTRDRGLGLASMEERVKILGGSLTIESQEGRGTAISINLPISGGQ